MRRTELDYELFRDFVRVARLLGRVPTWKDYNRHGRYHPHTIHKHIGFRNAQEMLMEMYPEFKEVDKDAIKRAVE